jgi:hypothetical protein
MTSEWMKVMLDEIARKKLETSEAQAELERRRREPETSSPDAASPGTTPGGRPPQ